MTTKIKSGAITAVLVALIIVLLTSFAYTFNPEEYKKENEFQSILDEFVTLDSVFNAIERAEIIVQKNEDNKNVRENYRNFTFYHDNPDISVHNVVKLMFEICAVKRQ